MKKKSKAKAVRKPAEFSELERKILSIVRRRKSITFTEIANRLHGKKKTINGNNIVATTVRRINKKCQMHDEPWFLNGSGQGRAGRTIWIAKW